jgi:hypothetical protein
MVGVECCAQAQRRIPQHPSSAVTSTVMVRSDVSSISTCQRHRLPQKERRVRTGSASNIRRGATCAVTRVGSALARHCGADGAPRAYRRLVARFRVTRARGLRIQRHISCVRMRNCPTAPRSPYLCVVSTAEDGELIRQAAPASGHEKSLGREPGTAILPTIRRAMMNF